LASAGIKVEMRSPDTPAQLEGAERTGSIIVTVARSAMVIPLQCLRSRFKFTNSSLPLLLLLQFLKNKIKGLLLIQLNHYYCRSLLLC
jgi:hypothetical protein